VPEDAYARLLAGPLLDLFGYQGRDAAQPRFPKRPPSRTDAGRRDSLDDEVAALEARALGHDHERVMLAVLLPFEDLLADAFDAEWNLRDEDHVGAARNSAVRGDPSGVTAHHLADQHALVARGGAPEPVEGVGRERDGRVEAEGDRRARDVVVDRLRDADHGDAGVVQLLGYRQRAVAADDHERPQAELVEVALGLGDDSRIDLARLAVAHLGSEPAAVAGAEDRAAEEQEAVHFVGIEHARAHRVEKALKAAQEPEGRPAILCCRNHDGADDSVQAGAVAPAGQDAYAGFHLGDWG
jgi:hypothetical protein